MNWRSNRFIKNFLELDELYIEIQKVSGFTVERLLELFLEGYTLKSPQYENLVEIGRERENNTAANSLSKMEQIQKERDAAVQDLATCGMYCRACAHQDKTTWPKCERMSLASGPEGNTVCANFAWRGCEEKQGKEFRDGACESKQPQLC